MNRWLWKCFGVLIFATFATFVISSGTARTAETGDEDDAVELPFWNIATADFYADSPRPISLPGIDGRIDYFWYWTFKFRYKTNLEVLSEYMERMQTELRKSSAEQEVFAIQKVIDRLQTTIKKIDANGDVPLEDRGDDGLVEQLRWRLAMSVTLRPAGGATLVDLRSDVVRNLIEKREKKQLYTADEIQRLSKKDVRETYDLDLGTGRWINGVAIFSGMPSSTREFEIRVSGMGKRLRPNFIPGQLIYAPSLHQNNITRATMRPMLRRAMRFFYHKIGQSGEPQLDAISLVRRSTEWFWAWAMQVYPGRVRQLELIRNPELADVPTITRRYVYFPYFVWNNTATAHKMSVNRAGLFADVKWRGEKIRVLCLDDGGADARWKEQAERAIKKRLANGEEKKFVATNEAYPLNYDQIDVKAYYHENYLDLEYAPANSPGYEKMMLARQQEVSREVLDSLARRKTADLQRKSNFVLNPKRLFVGSIDAGRVVNGVAIMHWGITDLAGLLADLSARLRAKALVAANVDDGSLLAAYQQLTSGINGGIEPSRAALIETLNKLAEQDLSEQGLTITADDRVRYGAAAPLGVWLSEQAWEAIVKRADERGITDAYIDATIDDAEDQAFLSARFQRYCPETRSVAPLPPDNFASDEAMAKSGLDAVAVDKKDTDDEEYW